MKARLTMVAVCIAMTLTACGGDSAPGAGSGGGSGEGGELGSGGVSGSGGSDIIIPGSPCGAPLSAPTDYSSEAELAALILGTWMVCDAPGLFTPKAVGIEFREDGVWVELFDVEGEIIRSQDERAWVFYQDERGSLTLALVLRSGGMVLYRPSFFEAEGQMQIEHIGDDLRLQRIDLH